MPSKHTPGPWRLHMSTIKSASGADVARIVSGWGVRDKGELLANAALIAAAPDLLAALSSIVESCAAGCGVSLHQFEAARSALNKARGDY